MSSSSAVPGLLNANPITIFLCFNLLRATCAELVASSQGLVAIGQTFHAVCHYEPKDVDRFLYWTVHDYPFEHIDWEFQANFGGIDLTTCSPFNFKGLSGQIACDLDSRSMRLHIDNVRPGSNGWNFSCTSDSGARSNEVTLIVGKPKLVTLEIEEPGDKNHTAGVGTALRATCRVDRSLNPKLLFWATSDTDETKNKSTFGGMIVEFCFRYKVRDPLHRRVDFNCRGPPDVASTLTVQSLPVGTAIFCYTIIDSGGVAAASRIESNWLAISGSGRFTKLLISARSSSVPISGRFYAKCRLLSGNGISNDYYDRIRWQGVSKFGKRADISYSKGQKESVLLIKPIYATDNQSQIFCRILGDAATQSERVIIKVTRKVPISVELLRDESTINPVPINGTFRAVCSFRNIDVQAVHWVATADHVKVGRVNISHGVCRTYTMITNTATAGRVQLSCDLNAKITTFSVQPVKGRDAGTEVYCSASDRYGLAVRSESLTIKTQAGRGVIAKTRPSYREATLAASCPFGNGTEHEVLVHSAGEDDTGSEEVRTGNRSDFRTFILLNRNCSVIDYALYLPRRFFVGCDHDRKSLTLIIDPVYGNASDALRVTCVWYASFPSTNGSSTPERKGFVQKRQIPQVVYPVSKPELKYSGDKIKLNGTQPDIWTSVWLIPVTIEQEMEFSCSAGPSQSSSFNLALSIQTDKDHFFRLLDGKKKPNGTTQPFNIRATVRMKTSYRGVFCVAENIVSRWESDFARILFFNTSVFLVLDDWMASNSSFFMRHVIPTLKLCYKLCEVYSDCQGVSYHHRLCSLSNRGFQDSQFVPKEGFSFYHRLQPEDILQRNDVRPDVYIKHENRTLPFHGDLDRRTGLTAIQCQKRCTKFLPCRSIQFKRAQKICHLSSLIFMEKDETTGVNRHDWDVYTKNNTPSSFVVFRDVSPDDSLKAIDVWFERLRTPLGAVCRYLSRPKRLCSWHLERQLMGCADYCRSKNDCVSFLSTVDERNNSMFCNLYDVNIPELRLVKHVTSWFKSSFYVRVRNINSELVPVNRLKIHPIA